MLGRLLPARPAQGSHEARDNISFTEMLRWRGEVNWVYSPMVVSLQRALTHSASHACIDTIASAVAQMPIDVVRKSGGRRIAVTPAPTLIDQPSAIVDTDVWLYQLLDSMCTDGNGFGLIGGVDAAARPTSIELVDPDQVYDRRVVDGVTQAAIGGTVHKVYPFGDLWHVPGKLVRAGSPFADSPLRRAAATIGVGLAGREYIGRYFGDSGHPAQHIKVNKPNSKFTEEEARVYKAAVLNAIRGNREPIVTGSDVDINELAGLDKGVDLLPLLQFIVVETARFWRVPPEAIYASMAGQNVTYANLDSKSLDLLKWGLEPYLLRVERALSRLLAGPQVVVLNRNALLRSDAKTRFQIYDIRLRQESMTVNELRQLEDEPPFADPKFDKPGIPDLPAVVGDTSPAPGDTKPG